MSSRPIIQGRAQILVGDTTSHGGVVISGSLTTTVQGRPIARVGDMVTCPLCKPHVFPIVEGLAMFTDNYMAVALHGHKIACGATLIAAANGSGGAPAVPSPTNPPSSMLNGKLGQSVDALVAMSPTLNSNLKTLQSQGWTVDYGLAGQGSYADRRTKTITLDIQLKTDPNQATQILAHEVGHALHPYQLNTSSRQAYLNGALDDEGAATLKNIQVQREIIAAGGPDIGIAGNPKNHASYIQAYNQYLKDGNAEVAIRKIGSQFGNGEFTSTTGQNYADYYGGWYDKHHGGKK
ncbi:putative Zn-binding protein involved in type VI secretion [Limnobacter thiooxidans]|uniref:PAAR domain-containing protein n=1 Tax=Limnobacter thiooxidans TaxID=131080 RepID=UPI0010CE16E6|nr:putative Zn-binding protein involved in type VI secretion [Limnobacter thiooxidans]